MSHFDGVSFLVISSLIGFVMSSACRKSAAPNCSLPTRPSISGFSYFYYIFFRKYPPLLFLFQFPHLSYLTFPFHFLQEPGTITQRGKTPTLLSNQVSLMKTHAFFTNGFFSQYPRNGQCIPSLRFLLSICLLTFSHFPRKLWRLNI